MWDVHDARGALRGAVKEKLKIIGTHWVLQNSEGKEIATIKGNRKKHNYEVRTADKQVIARCNPINKESYRVDIQGSDVDPFLVLSYIIVLDHVSSWKQTSGGMTV